MKIYNYVYSYKKLKSLKVTSKLQSVDELNKFQCEIEYELPNQHLYEFVGNLKFDDGR
jgi:hypothetical protein